MISKITLNLVNLLLFTTLVIVFLHLAKDITQDILKISSPFYYLGNAQENLSPFPSFVKQLFIAFGYISLIIEIFIVLAIIIYLRDNSKAYLLKPILISSAFLFLYLLTAALLDSRFNPWLKITAPNPIIDPRTKTTKNLIISTDNSSTAKMFKFFTGEPDDSLALAILLNAHKSKKMNILGITTTFGNTDGETSYQITKKQVELSGQNIPVKKGAVYAGQNNSEAVDFVANVLKNSNEKVVLVALGPVTDYAAIFKKYPELKEKVEYFLLVRSGPYLNKNRWFLFSFNAQPDVNSAIFMYEFGANQFRMGEEIFPVTVTDSMINRLKQINNPMMKFISSDLKKWNTQNKFFPIKGYLSRGGNMCPWDLVWSMYLVEPNLFNLEKETDSFSLHIKDRQTLIENAEKYLIDW